MRLKGIKRFHYARDVEEALSLLSAYQGRGAILAGGLDLARSARADLEGLIDISGMGLSYVRKQEGSLHIGATTTLTQLLESPESADYTQGILKEVLRQVAVPPLRNQATIGGALVSAHPWADLPTLLVALSAEVRWCGEHEERAKVEELYKRPFRKILRPAVVTEITLPGWDGAFAFEKLARSAYDIALLNCVCGLGVEDGKIAWARVAVGATPRRGQRLLWLEDALVGESPSEALWEQVRREAADKVEVGDDRRASADWRKAALGAVIARTLKRAAEKTVMGNAWQMRR